MDKNSYIVDDIFVIILLRKELGMLDMIKFIKSQSLTSTAFLLSTLSKISQTLHGINTQ